MISQQKIFQDANYASHAECLQAKKAWINEMRSQGFTVIPSKMQWSLMRRGGIGTGMNDEEYWTKSYLVSAVKRND